MTRSDTSDDRALEERPVEVADPLLSAHINRRLTEEVREVIGADRVRVPADRPHPSRGEEAEPTSRLPFADVNHVALLFGAASGVVGMVVISLTTNEWWLLPIVFVVLAVATSVVAMAAFALTASRERPSPSTIALMDEEGVPRPEQRFSAIIEEFTEDEGGRGEGRRTTPVQSDPVTAAAEQQSALSATGGPSRPKIRSTEEPAERRG